MTKKTAAAAPKRKPASGKAEPKTKAKSKITTKAASAASPEVRADAPRPSEPRPDHLFKPGQSGNPAGRPKGIRQQLASDFVRVLQEDFKEHGAGVIAQLRADKPGEYARIIAAVLPKVIEVEDDDGEGQKVTGVLLVTKSRIDSLIADGSGQ